MITCLARRKAFLPASPPTPLHSVQQSLRLPQVMPSRLGKEIHLLGLTSNCRDSRGRRYQNGLEAKILVYCLGLNYTKIRDATSIQYLREHFFNSPFDQRQPSMHSSAKANAGQMGND